MVKSLVIRGPGTNCDMETEYAFRLSGSEVRSVYIDTLLENRQKLENFQIIALPGGFTYGDDLGAGKVMAVRLKKIKDALIEFVERGNLIIGICNGFQILVKMGLLPGIPDVKATLAVIPGGTFRDQWLELEVLSEVCVFTRGIKRLRVPMANAEGRFITGDEEDISKLREKECIALKYISEDPTGSPEKIAGITDLTGRILGLMPHPERNLFVHSPPDWQDGKVGGDGIKIFKNAVDYFDEQ